MKKTIPKRSQEMKYFEKTKVKFTGISLNDNDIQIPDKIEISEKMHKDKIGGLFAPLSKSEIKVVKPHN